jgi:hypothetical protein
VADIGEKLRPALEPLLEEGETLEGMCVGSRSGLMSSKFVVIGVTPTRLIVQETDRKQNPKGEATIVAAGDLAGSRESGFGANPVTSSIMEKTSIKLTVKTTSGEKVKLMIGRGGGDGMFGKLMGGPTQAEGVEALQGWLERNAQR